MTPRGSRDETRPRASKGSIVLGMGFTFDDRIRRAWHTARSDARLDREATHASERYLPVHRWQGG